MTTISNSTTYWTSTANAVAATNTLTSSTATATTESKKKPTWKWSGEDTPFDHRCTDDDEDEEGYDDYEVDSGDRAFLNEEEEEESDKHRFGLCWSCKKGLDDRADFVCDDRENGVFFFMCTDCYEGYIQPWYFHEEKQGADP